MPNKYRNKPTEVDNIRFASKREANRYQELRLLERAKLIKDLELQVRFPIVIFDSLVCTYIADFVFIDTKTKERVVEDSKGVRTREFILKKKLMRAVHNIIIRET